MGDIETLKQDGDVFFSFKNTKLVIDETVPMTIGYNFSAFPTRLYYLEMCFP